jgi:hypothetical protein
MAVEPSLNVTMPVGAWEPVVVMVAVNVTVLSRGAGF